MSNISKHLTYNQIIFSNTALKYNIPNIPSNSNLEYIKDLAENIYEPIYNKYDGKVYITSCYRSPELNSKLGGVKSSQHQALRGAALDLVSTNPKVQNIEIFNWVLDNLEFDQLIAEKMDNEDNPKWLHISYNKNSNRNQLIYT